MSDGDYESDFKATPERIVALLLVVLWVTLAFSQLALFWAVRVTLMFLLALGMIWLPAILARIRSRDFEGYDGTIAPNVVRWVGWAILVGLPLVWFLFSRVFHT